MRPGESHTALVKAMGSAFSSVSVLNASFRVPKPLGATMESSGVDLLKVRKAYTMLVFELGNPELVNMLGRATVSICEELSKQRVPTEDPETLCVFLVIFEKLGAIALTYYIYLYIIYYIYYIIVLYHIILH